MASVDDPDARRLPADGGDGVHEVGADPRRYRYAGSSADGAQRWAPTPVPAPAATAAVPVAAPAPAVMPAPAPVMVATSAHTAPVPTVPVTTAPMPTCTAAPAPAAFRGTRALFKAARLLRWRHRLHPQRRRPADARAAQTTWSPCCSRSSRRRRGTPPTCSAWRWRSRPTSASTPSSASRSSPRCKSARQTSRTLTETRSQSSARSVTS